MELVWTIGPGHLCCIAHEKNLKRRFSGKSTTGSTSTSVFLRTAFRNSAITPASPLIKKSTTLRSSLWCFHCRVAKRQQFSCPLGTASLSLKLENVVPGCWICFFSYYGQVFFFKQKTAYEIASCLVGSEMCIRDRFQLVDRLLNKLSRQLQLVDRLLNQ